MTNIPLGKLGDAAGLIAGLSGLTLGILLIQAIRRLRGTTLVAPCCWAIASVACVTAVAVAHTLSPEGTSAPLRFMAAAGTFCPVMAVLGAKRPQHVGWQWVVASLWLVLVWPAGQALLAGTGLELFIAWKLFLLGLIVVGLLNYLPTSHWLASLLVAAGQAALVTEFVWSGAEFDPGEMLLVAVVLFLAAGLVTWSWSNRSTSSSAEPSSPMAKYDRRWQRFRDAYGAFWALRILGRVNETAGLQDWPMQLEWQGFVATRDQPPSEQQLQEVEQCWSTLMRRFW